MGDVVDSPAFLTQKRPLREEVEELSPMTNLGNQQVEMKEWTTPLGLGRDFSSMKEDTG